MNEYGSPVAITTPISHETALRRHTPRRDIQGLRALAVIAVVAFHAGLPIPGGFVGVDIFFVISGYVITGMLIREWGDRGEINLRRFYVRRIKRLLPALFVVVLITLALSFLFGSPFDRQQSTTALTAFGAMTMTANAVIFLNSGGYFAVPPTSNPLLNTWSLSVEEQFYLVFPFVLLALLILGTKVISGRNRQLILILGLSILGALSFFLSLAMSYGRVSLGLSDPEWFAFYASPTRAWEFAAGAVAYLATASFIKRTRPKARLFVYWSAVALLLASLLLINEHMSFPGWIALLPVGTTALVLMCGEKGVPGDQFFTNSVMTSVGDASYSWYLWHWPLIVFALVVFPEASHAALIAALVSLVVAALSLRFIENPLRFSTSFNGRKVVILAFISVVTVGLVSATLFRGAQSAWGSAQIRSMQEQVSAIHLWQSTDCNVPTPLGARGANCTWNEAGDGLPVYLVGDSMAGALSEAVLGAAARQGRPAMAGTLGACPFITAQVWLEDGINENCWRFVDQSTQWLLQQEPSDVVVSSSLGYTILDYVTLVNPATQRRGRDPESKTEVYLDGLGSLVQELSEVGHRVTVVLPPPGFPRTVMGPDAWFPSQCTTLRALSDTPACGQTRSMSEVREETELLFEAIIKTVNDAGGKVVDPQSAICEEDTCATNRGNEWLYIDGSHISVGLSEDLSGFIGEALR